METILVVDDNHQIADFTAGTLLPSWGYNAVKAYDGLSAFKILQSQAIALMLLDLQLPDISGLDLLRKLAQEKVNIPPTILMTAHGSEQVAADAFRLGVEDYISKPADPDVLSAAITLALTESRLRNEKQILTQKLQEQVSWLTLLSKVGQSITSTLEHENVLIRIVEAGVLATRAEEGFLALLDQSNDKLYLRAAKNIDEKKIKTVRLLVTDPLVSHVFKTAAPLRTTQTRDSSPLKVATGYLVHSLLYVPLLSKGKVIGVLSANHRTNRQVFTESDEALLTSLADYAMIAIENANLYQQAQQEIGERTRVEHELRETQERYTLAVRGANDGLWDWDLKTHKVYYSPRWKSMLGFRENEIGNGPDEWFARIHPEDRERAKLEITSHIKGVTSHFQHEHRILHKDGTYRWVQSRGIAVWDSTGIATRIAGSQTDITDRKFAEEKLLYDAFHDRLTNLANRALFIDRLRYSMERAKRRPNYKYAVLFLDIDRFKDTNDSLGHMLGDRLLIEAAHIIAQILRPTDTVARLGGDEFVILLEEINGIHDATQVADRIQSELNGCDQLDGHQIYVTASMGIVLSDLDYTQPEDVLRDADIAMYRAKELGRARYEVFNPTLRDRIIERLSIEKELRQAVEHDQFEVCYQPIFSLKTGRIASFEALVRWRHPTRGIVLPGEFISVAEDAGLIIPIDNLVLRKACHRLSDLQIRFPTNPPLTISVNLSGKHIAQLGLVEKIENVLHESNLPANTLHLEITESVIMEYNQLTTNLVSRLRAMGIHILIDDFGIGYSSLSYLSHFGFSMLKIDRSFVSAIERGGSDVRIIQAIVMMAHGLGMGVVAEGVETEAQLTYLKTLGCEYGQGDLLSKPLYTRGLIDLLARQYNQSPSVPPFSLQEPDPANS